MNRADATEIFAALDKHEAWSPKEYEKGVAEAEAEGEEPMVNPRVFDLRLDATRDANYGREYRVRVTGCEWTERKDWQFVLQYAEDHDIDYVQIQNSGIELA